jgi:group I intron endonuclease
MRIIYLITNLINGKKYVGQTKNLERRKKSHFVDGPRDRDHLFARAVRKHGRENFEISIIEECEDDLADEREVFWISELKTTNVDFGYNLESGGNSCKKLGEETKRKISESRKKWWNGLTEEEKKAFHDRIPRKRMTEENKKKLLESVKGVPKSEEHKQKISMAHLTRICKENCQCCKCVSRPSKLKKLSTEQEEYIAANGNGTWSSHKNLAQLFNVSPTTISRAWKKKREEHTTPTSE